jgi:RimJ/RimL family protein N-acetyltransferase
MLETERLIIRNFQSSDWQSLHELIVQYQASEFAPYDQQWPTSQEDIRKITEYFAGGDNFMAICLKNTQQLIGFVSLNPEKGDVERQFNMGYVFNSDFHGQGYAIEACRAVLRRAFDQLQACRVVTGTASINQASRRLLEQLGFKKVGEETASFKTTEDGKPIEFLGWRYAILKEEWQNSNP